MFNYDIFSAYPYLKWILPALLIFDLVLKGISLYRAGKNKQKYWFIALLIVNSMGILPLIYLLTNPDKKVNKK